MKQKQSLYPNFLRNSVQLFTIAFLVSFLVNMNSFAQEGKVDFSGEWFFNESKSDMGEGRFQTSLKLTVKQEGNNLTIERLQTGRDGQEMKITQKLTLDGKESKNTARRGTRKSTATWSDNGKTLTIKSTMAFDRGGETMEMKSVDQWKLSGGGKILSIESSSSTPRGERKATMVYDKK
ncbi:MAG: hypothetical protein J7K53_05790 [Bacteroidales bacterium]|nr:hypothetical protein [Bacteroidales bacterium]